MKIVMARRNVMALAQNLATLALPHAQLSLTCHRFLMASWGQNSTSTAGCPFSRSARCNRARNHPSQRRVRDPISDLKLMREKLWREFFSDPSQWWDHRSEKLNPRYPDFKHKRTGQSLWLHNSLTPPWVEAELATMAPGLLQPHMFSWHIKLRRHLEAEDYEKTLNLFQQMQREGMIPDKFTFVAVLNACSNLRSLEKGRRVHQQIIQSQSDIYVTTCLVDMYAKCGSIEDAWSVFNEMPERDVVSWNAMIVGYAKSEQGLKALELFREMQQGGLEPNNVTFVGVLNACASVAGLEEGRRVHEQIIWRGCESHLHIANCLIDMYAKCGSIQDACSVFARMGERSVVSWNTMIGGYVKSEQGLKALELFRKMQQEGVEPNTVTFVGVLSACASLAALKEGRRVHEQVIRSGCESDVYVANCLVDMYAKCGSIDHARSVFNNMRARDVVSWNAMIVGYVKFQKGLNALELFRKMQQEGVDPDSVTLVGVLSACASVAALKEGRRVHKQIIRRGFQSDVYVATGILDMYAKCGSIKDAWSVFNKMRKRNVVSWSAMVGGYAMHGYSKKAIGLFKRMSKEGIEINQITFTCILSACSHRGLVKEGLRYFNTMSSHYCLLPTIEHYACMVDLLGRAGRLEEAEEMIKRVPMKRDSYMWMSLLSACRIHGNIEIAEQAAKRYCQLDRKNASAHVLLSNIYAAAEHWDRSAAIGKDRLRMKVWKEPSCTWMEVDNVMYSFVAHEKEHPQLFSIHSHLERLSMQMNQAGYIQKQGFLLHEGKKQSHLRHSSKKLGCM